MLVLPFGVLSILQTVFGKILFGRSAPILFFVGGFCASDYAVEVSFLEVAAREIDAVCFPDALHHFVCLGEHPPVFFEVYDIGFSHGINDFV